MFDYYWISKKDLQRIVFILKEYRTMCQLLLSDVNKVNSKSFLIDRSNYLSEQIGSIERTIR